MERLGWVETYSDHSDRAIEYFQRALRLSPFDPTNFNNYVGMASANEVAQRYDDAVALYRRALQERPHAAWIGAISLPRWSGLDACQKRRQSSHNFALLIRTSLSPNS